MTTPRAIINAMRDAGSELRMAARAFRRAPGFAIATTGTLALGLALLTATLALVNAYLIRSMPYPHADRLYHVAYAVPGEREPGGMSALDWSAISDVVEIADNSAPARFYLGEGVDRTEALGLRLARGAGEMLGVRAVLGRALQPHDYDAAAEPVIMIGHELWRTRFNRDPQVVGRVLRASAAANTSEPMVNFRIVGVLPEDFHYARGYDRGAMEFVAPLTRPLTTYLVRLREGVPVPHAAAVITAAVRRAATSIPAGWSAVQLESVHERYAGELRPVLRAITAAALCVLIIVSLNVVLLVLLRVLRRQKELAVRMALGAGRGQLVRTLLAETTLITATALLSGVLLATALLRGIEPHIEERLGRVAPGSSNAITVDQTVLLGVGGAAVLLTLLLSLVPVLAPWQGRVASALRRSGMRSAETRTTRRVRAGMVAIEIAASLTLLVGGGLMLRSILNMLNADLGYRTEQIVRARIALPTTYDSVPTLLDFYDRLATRLSDRNLDFAFSNSIPFYQYPQQTVEIDGVAEPRGDAGVMAVSVRYFELFGMHVRQGRGITATDRPNAAPVAIVSASLAQRLWPGSDPLGRLIRTAAQEDRGVPAEWRTIVGVVNDVRQTHTDVDLDDVYIPFAQTPARFAPLYLRTDRAAAIWDDVRADVAAIDTDVLLSTNVSGSGDLSIEAQLLLAGPRFLTTLLTAFALFAALLALLGVFGVTAYAVQQRERELAIRAAVGATRNKLIGLFLRDAALMLAIAMMLAVPGVMAIGRLLRHQLFNVPPLDITTLLFATAIMAVAALLASWLPTARRGAIRDPLSVLNEG